MKTLSNQPTPGTKAAPPAPPGPADPAKPPELGGARARIDALDDEILDLLGRRADVAKQIATAKRAAAVEVFHDPERERQVLERLMQRGEGRFPRDAIRAVFREVMSACLSVEEPLRVAYLGPEGTYSQMAARHLFGLSARYRECATIEAVFDAVESRDVTYGVVPFENSTEGAVSMTSDAMLEGQLMIRQEYVLPVAHCLLATATSLSSIMTVYSHPQALAQSREWLGKHVPRAQIIQTTSTTAAVREVLADDRAAAVAAELSSEIYGVPILRRNIQDRPENATRFVVIAKEDAKPTGNDRTTLAFAVSHKQGALRRVLSEFETAGVNLSRIESRPSRKEAWQYVFLVDVEGHRTDPALVQALAAVKKNVSFLKVIGSYPRADVFTAVAKMASGPDD
ncbi:MAG: prephenate dehydratase [Polyangiaceae bacterium]|nr:prephenate dehydratase [Polyangiaceae bacterium]